MFGFYLLKDCVRRIVFGFDFLYKLYIYASLVKNRVFFIKKTIFSGFYSCILSRAEVQEKIEKGKLGKNSDICHIIGSGWSLNESMGLVGDKDFVIGFNYSALAPLRFDAYFFEFGGTAVEDVSRAHLFLAQQKVLNQTDLVFFKNIWEGKNEAYFIYKNWFGVAFLVRDSIYPLGGNVKLLVESIFNDRSRYLPQACSTMVTLVALAYRSGFKKIVLHGLDFGGEYFYQVKGARTEFDFSVIAGGGYSNQDSKSIHPTALGKVGMKELLPVIFDFCNSRGVFVYCGTSKSPSSEYLPVFKREG